MKNLLYVLLILPCILNAQQSEMPDNAIFTVNAESVVGKNTEFWKAAGSDYLFNHVAKPSGQVLLDRMAETQSHVYLRTHHTFVQDMKKGDLRGQNVYSEDEKGNPVYDFSNVNRVFAEYVKRGLKPIVEYDYLPQLLELNTESVSKGNNEGMEMRNTGPNDWGKWYDLMLAATKNFIDEFGTEEVRSWYFEVWNEPDGWPIDQLDVFFKMYDLFVDAVTSVDSELRVGGPACYHEHFLRPFLNHAVNGTNHVTGERGTRIDFISYHIYGLSGKWLNNEPHIHPQVQRFSQSVLWLSRLLREFPELEGTEFHINEWGLSSNFFRTVDEHPDLVYRNSHESAIFLVKLVNSLYQIEDNYGFPISMLLYWGFTGEAEKDEFFMGMRELTTAGDVPKPIQTGFELLAKLEGERLGVTRRKKDDRFGLLATKSKSENLALVAYNYLETDQNCNENSEMLIHFRGLTKNTVYNVMETKMDETTHNTYSSWQKQGKPVNSKNADLKALMDAADLQPTNEYTIKTDNMGNASIKLKLVSHSMKLIQMNEK